MKEQNETLALVNIVGRATLAIFAVLMLGSILLMSSYYTHQENMAEIQYCGEIE